MSSSFDEDLFEQEVVLPPREFMYTLEQIAQMLDVSFAFLKEDVVFFRGRSAGSKRGKMEATNIAAPDKPPVWRVGETNFMLWMRARGITFEAKRNIRLNKVVTKR